jgi:hypothetical protein
MKCVCVKDQNSSLKSTTCLAGFWKTTKPIISKENAHRRGNKSLKSMQLGTQQFNGKLNNATTFGFGKICLLTARVGFSKLKLLSGFICLWR